MSNGNDNGYTIDPFTGKHEVNSGLNTTNMGKAQPATSNAWAPFLIITFSSFFILSCLGGIGWLWWKFRKSEKVREAFKLSSWSQCNADLAVTKKAELTTLKWEREYFLERKRIEEEAKKEVEDSKTTANNVDKEKEIALKIEAARRKYQDLVVEDMEAYEPMEKPRETLDAL